MMLNKRPFSLAGSKRGLLGRMGKGLLRRATNLVPARLSSAACQEDDDLCALIFACRLPKAAASGGVACSDPQVNFWEAKVMQQPQTLKNRPHTMIPGSQALNPKPQTSMRKSAAPCSRSWCLRWGATC